MLCSRNNLSDDWTALSWIDFDMQVSIAAKALFDLGVVEHECVGQFSQNKAENLIVDFALYTNRAVMVPMYATSSTPQVEFIVNDSEIKNYFCWRSTTV